MEPRDQSDKESGEPAHLRMDLEQETLVEISTFVRAGLYDRERIFEILLGDMYDPGDLDPEEVEIALDAAIAAHEADKQTWPAVTDCDRLDAAFTSLRTFGIIALHNAGLTQSDGYSDFQEALAEAPDKSRIEGYCFYSWQDLELAVAGDGLYLAFGPTNPREEVARGPAVGNIVASALRDAGLEVDWDGSFGTRIHLPRIDWKRR